MGARSILIDGLPVARTGEVVQRIEPLDDNRHAWILGGSNWRSYAWSWSVWRWALDDGRMVLAGEGEGQGVGFAARGGRVFVGGRSWEVRWQDLDGGASGAVAIESGDGIAGCSPDGRYLVTRREGARRRLWCRIRPVAGEMDPVPEVEAPLVFSDDSRFAAHFGEDRASLQWVSVENGAGGSVAIEASESGWRGICAVRGGARMIAWDRRQLVVCDLETQRVAGRVAVDALDRVVDAAGGRVVIATSGPDAAIEALDLERGARVRLPGLASLTPDGRRALCKRGSALDVVDVTSGVVFSAHQGQCQTVRGLVWSRDGAAVATSGDDGRVRLLRVTDPPGVRELAGERRGVLRVAFSPEGERLCVVTSSAIEVADVATGAITARFASFGTYIHSAEISSDGRHLVAGSYGHGVRVFDLATGTQIASECDATRGASRAVLAGQHIIALSHERLAGPAFLSPVELVHWVRLDRTGAILGRGTWRFEGAHSSIELCVDGVAAMVAWYPRDGHRLCTFELRAPGEPGRVVPIPPGAKLVDGRDGRALFLERDDVVCRDPETGDESWRVHCPRWPWDASLSHDGEAVAVAYRDGGVEVFVRAR